LNISTSIDEFSLYILSDELFFWKRRVLRVSFCMRKTFDFINKKVSVSEGVYPLLPELLLRFSDEISIRGVALAGGLFVGGFATVLVMGLKGRGYPLGPIGLLILFGFGLIGRWGTAFGIEYPDFS
jgi:hypothetical protein